MAGAWPTERGSMFSHPRPGWAPRHSLAPPRLRAHRLSRLSPRPSHRVGCCLVSRRRALPHREHPPFTLQRGHRNESFPMKSREVCTTPSEGEVGGGPCCAQRAGRRVACMPRLYMRLGPSAPPPYPSPSLHIRPTPAVHHCQRESHCSCGAGRDAASDRTSQPMCLKTKVSPEPVTTAGLGDVIGRPPSARRTASTAAGAAGVVRSSPRS